MLPTVFCLYTDGTQFDSVKNSYAENALRQSEKKRQKQIAKKKGFFEDVKERRRIWSMMRKKSNDEADIPGKAKKTLGIPLEAGLLYSNKTIQKNF